MASVGGMIGANGSSSSSSWIQMKNMKKKKMMIMNRDRVKVICSASSSSVMDPYKTLRIQPGASESDVKKAFRHLALQYHPDVCRGNNCGVQFHLINEAYDIVMSNLREETNEPEIKYQPYDECVDETMRGMNDPDWDLWEEWMGWEGATLHTLILIYKKKLVIN